MPLKTPWLLPLGVAVCLAWMTWGSLHAQQEVAPDDETATQISERVDDFLRRVGRGEVKDAVESLLAESPLRENFARVNELRDAIRRELPKYGPFLGAENIRTERLGRSLLECVALYKGQEFPVIWRFTFYRPDTAGEWVLVAVRFDVNYERLSGGKSRDVDAGN